MEEQRELIEADVVEAEKLVSDGIRGVVVSEGAEFKESASGKAYARFRIAWHPWDPKQRKEIGVVWVQITVFGALAKRISDRTVGALHKGDQVVLLGSFEVEEYEGKQYAKMVAREVGYRA